VADSKLNTFHNLEAFFRLVLDCRCPSKLEQCQKRNLHTLSNFPLLVDHPNANQLYSVNLKQLKILSLPFFIFAATLSINLTSADAPLTCEFSLLDE
jgi:hypothetical protein